MAVLSERWAADCLRLRCAGKRYARGCGRSDAGDGSASGCSCGRNRANTFATSGRSAAWRCATDATSSKACAAARAEVWVAGRRVGDVTTDPVFARPVQSIAELYDLQVSPEHREAMTYAARTPANRPAARSSSRARHADLVKRRQTHEGLGRCDLRPGRPLAGLSQHRADDVRRGRRFLRPARRAQFADNVRNYYTLLPRPRPVPHPRHRQSADRPLEGLARAGATNSRISAWSRRPRTA